LNCYDSFYSVIYYYPVAKKGSRDVSWRGMSIRPIAYIEEKPVNYDRVLSLLSLSRSQNHWANFGPVTHQLETHLSDFLSLPEDAAVIMANNCTSVLEALSQVVQFNLGRKPRWAVPAYSFFSTLRSSFTDSIIIDCDGFGLISLEELEALPVDLYDGIVLVNVFGICTDIGPWLEFAERRGKYLILDNAAAYRSLERGRVTPTLLEAISFHHTKANGFGEGGCAIIHRQNADTFRSIINFGVKLETNQQKLGFNGKISETSSAFILQRLQDYQNWEPLYLQQAQRLRNLAAAHGVGLLKEDFDIARVVVGNLPFIFPHPISKEDLDNDYVILRKYYSPCAPLRNAEKIFEHIVNFPCHPGLAQLSDTQISSIFEGLLDG